MQKARRQAFPLRGIALRPLVGMWFQVHYPPLVGVLLIFRSRYCYAIGRQGVLSLTGWSPWLPTGFPVPGRTQEPVKEGRVVFAYRAVTFCGGPFHGLRLSADFVTPWILRCGSVQIPRPRPGNDIGL